MLSDYGDGEAIGVPDTQKRLMLDAFRAQDRWRKPTASARAAGSPSP